jgi:myb proto-oncogene protein
MAGQLAWGGLIEEGWRKGPWTAEEDRLLIEYVRLHGDGRWSSVARLAGVYLTHLYIQPFLQLLSSGSVS